LLYVCLQQPSQDILKPRPQKDTTHKEQPLNLPEICGEERKEVKDGNEEYKQV